MHTNIHERNLGNQDEDLACFNALFICNKQNITIANFQEYKVGRYYITLHLSSP